MNRHQRRSLASRTRAAVPDSVRLDGGPMDGYVVTPDAAALRPGWHAEYAEAMTALGRPVMAAGAYAAAVLVDGVRTSRWVDAD